MDLPLMSGGDSKRVNNRNKEEFVNLATKRRLLGGADAMMMAMRSGVTDVIPKNLLAVLLPSEVRFRLLVLLVRVRFTGREGEIHEIRGERFLSRIEEPKRNGMKVFPVCFRG